MVSLIELSILLSFPGGEVEKRRNCRTVLDLGGANGRKKGSMGTCEAIVAGSLYIYKTVEMRRETKLLAVRH